MSQPAEQLWEEIITTLVAPKRRERARYWLAAPKRRDRIVDELTDATFFNHRVLHNVSPATADAVFARLCARGAPGGCRVFSPRGDAGGTPMDLRAALEQHVGAGDDVLIYCPEGPSGYYEAHHPGAQYVLERP